MDIPGAGQLEDIALQQLNNLTQAQQKFIFQLINEAYQQILDGDADNQVPIKTSFKHNTETDIVFIKVLCPLDRVAPILTGFSDAAAMLINRCNEESDEHQPKG